MKEGAEASLSFTSSLPDVEKPLWLKRLWAGTEMIGAGSWLLPACLEKLQEISGMAAFFVETQTAAEKTLSGTSIWKWGLCYIMFEFKALVNNEFYLLEQAVRKTQLQ